MMAYSFIVRMRKANLAESCCLLSDERKRVPIGAKDRGPTSPLFRQNERWSGCDKGCRG